MSTSEEGALVTEIEDRLIQLYVRQDEARRAKDREGARELEIEIDQVRARREEIRRLRAYDHRKQRFGRI